MIDPETVRNLEIVDTMGNASVLNHCSTAMARRLLRATLLAPVTVRAGIEARLDVVGGIPTPWTCSIFHSELVQSEDRYADVKDALKQLREVDPDKLLGFK